MPIAPLAVASADQTRVLVLLACSPLELHLHRSPTGLVLAWWRGMDGRRLPARVAEA